MAPDIDRSLATLVQSAALHPSVRAIGLSGGDRPYPNPGEGDLDLFLYCSQVPDPAHRLELLQSLGEGVARIETGAIAAGHWGVGDRCFLFGIETWLLYFTLEETWAELDSILAGQFPDRVDNDYYPLARCAMWKTMRPLYDPDGLLHALRARLAEYPPDLARAVVAHHLAALEDVEDLERAVQRQDVFFYHFAFDLALDHFLQALFALNRAFFPSRKRSEENLQRFQLKPANCLQRLRQAVALGANPETLAESYRLWQELVLEVRVWGIIQ